MKKTPPKKSRQPKKKTTPSTKKKWIIITLLAIVIIGVGVVKINNQRVINNEKAQYQAATVDIKKLEKELNGEFTPAKIYERSGCTGASNTNEFAQDIPTCSVGFSLRFSVSSVDEAQNLTAKVSNYLKQDNSSFKYDSSSSALATTKPPTELFSQSFSSSSGLGCGAAYTHYVGSNPPRVDKELIIGGDRQALVFDFSCGGRTHSYKII